MARALADRDWHARVRTALAGRSARLATLLVTHGLAPDGGCAFFHWRRDARAAQLHDALARRGILVRHFDAPASLRFGLPRDAADFDRLDAALAAVMA